MAHQWEEARTGTDVLMRDPKRRCRNCGAEQEKVWDYWWGRKLRPRWEPKAGRCIGTVAQRLAARRADTRWGAEVLLKAQTISRQHPELTEGQCIRAAYWGSPGEP